MVITPGSKGLRRTDGPDDIPVSVAYVQAWGNITGDDTLLTNMIKAATDLVEKHTKRALISQEWTMTLDRWPGGTADWWDIWHSLRTDPRDTYLELDYAPLQTVDSISTFADDNTKTTITVTDYFYVDTNHEPGRLALKNGLDWPVDTRNVARVEIVYTSGYSDDDTDVPDGLKMALAQLTTWMYEHRGDCDAGPALMKSGAASTLAPFRILDIY